MAGGGIAVVRARYLRTFIEVLEERGHDYREWLDAIHIPDALLERPEVFMPRHQIYTFATLATHESGIPTLAFLAGGRMGIDEMGRAGHAICSAPTLDEAIRTACRTFSDESSHFRLFREDADDGLRFCRGPVRGDPPTRTVVELYDLAVMTNIVRLALGPTWCPKEVCLQTTDSKVLGSEDLFPATVTMFGASATTLHVPATALRWPVHTQRTMIDPTRDVHSPPMGLVDSLGAVLSAHPLDALPSVDCLAEIVGLSLRTLQRRLAAAGTTYWELVGRRQCGAAEALLSRRDVAIREIAATLGYRDAGSFTRAFRRWTGTSPRSYRGRRQSRALPAVTSGRASSPRPHE